MEREVTRAIITDEEGRVLLGKRARGIGVNKWALVGGKPDSDESMEDAVRREVKEELGVDFEPTFYCVGLDTSTTPEHPWRVYSYTGPVRGELNPNPDEIIEVRYVTLEDLALLDLAFDNREKLEEFFKRVVLRSRTE